MVSSRRQQMSLAESNERRRHRRHHRQEPDRNDRARQDKSPAQGRNQNICTRVPPMMAAYDNDCRPPMAHVEAYGDNNEASALTCRPGALAASQNPPHHELSGERVAKMIEVRTDKCLQRQTTSSSNARPRTRTKTRTRFGTRADRLGNLLIVACVSLILMPLLAQVKYSTTQGAVIRPTIFSDLPPDSPTSGQQQQAPPSLLPPATAQQSQQQQNNQQQAPQAQQQAAPQQASSGHQYLNSHTHTSQSHWHLSQPHQAGKLHLSGLTLALAQEALIPRTLTWRIDGGWVQIVRRQIFSIPRDPLIQCPRV